MLHLVGRESPAPITTLQMARWRAEDFKRFADEYLAECFRRQTPPQAAELAARAGLSAGGFSNIFLHATGERPAAYFHRRQVQRAKQLLAETTVRMNSIAYGCGFGTRATFFRVFRRLVRLTPGAYRKAFRSRHRNHHQR